MIHHSKEACAELMRFIEAAGPEGVTVRSLMPRFGECASTVRNLMCSARERGMVVYTLRRQPQGGIFFARREWLDAAAEARVAQMCAIKRARNAKREAARKAKAAALRALMPPKPPKPPKVAKPKPEPKPRPVKAPRLHALGAVIPKAITRDGKPMTPHQQTAQRALRPTISVRPVDTSGARITVCPSLDYDPRYQLPPGERIVGGFASMGVGRYLEDAR